VGPVVRWRRSLNSERSELRLREATATLRFVTETAPWIEIVDQLALPARGNLLVAGQGAEELAVALNRRGPARELFWGQGVALLVRHGGLRLEPQATLANTSLAAGSLEGVVLLGAWEDAGGLGASLREAARLLVTGGGVLVGELSVADLVAASPRRYLHRLLTLRHPQLVDRMSLRHPDGAALATEVVRSGFEAAHSQQFEVARATPYSWAGYLEFVEKGGWPGWDGLGPEAKAEMLTELETALPSLAPLDRIQASEPWNVVTASRR